MRRWNGWGDESLIYPLPGSAARHLEAQLGPGAPMTDASLEQALASVPPTRLAAHPYVSDDPVERLRHAHGQSLPDWVALRSGRISALPDGVAHPTDEGQVRALIDFARQSGARLIPYGGGTSVVGGVNPPPGGAPILTLDLRRLNRLLDLDEVSRLATFEAGVIGPEIEGQLETHGYTLGHFPQSFEFSTLGGWVATRSSGQQSYLYGRIEDLFAGGHLETPTGPLDIPAFPASAAGPDLRHLILGSEGRLGVITRATVRVRPLPQVERFYAAFFPDWLSGTEAVRRIAQEGLRLSMLRLSDPQETETTLQLVGRGRLVEWAERGLRAVGYRAGRCLLIYAVTGDRGTTNRAQRRAVSLVREHRGLPVGTFIGGMWRKSRFFSPYLRNTLWERGYAVDTLETALPWSRVLPAAEAIKGALRTALVESDERVLAFAHLSHVYPDGASVYITALFRRVTDPDETLRRWQRLKSAASETVVVHGGTISHQHGVGRDHASYLEAEKGPLGMATLQAIVRALDPEGLMNPGVLLGKA